MNLSASFAIHSGTNFGLMIQGVDPILPLHVSMRVRGLYLGTAVFSSSRQTAEDVAFNTVVAATVADAAGKDAPFSGAGRRGMWTTLQLTRFHVRL